jgi:hypothetical protein
LQLKNHTTLGIRKASKKSYFFLFFNSFKEQEKHPIVNTATCPILSDNLGFWLTGTVFLKPGWFICREIRLKYGIKTVKTDKISLRIKSAGATVSAFSVIIPSLKVPTTR